MPPELEAGHDGRSLLSEAGLPLPEETLPRQFGKYTLLRKLAAGGMAELFLALHRSVAGFEKLIVIKRILPSMNQDKGFIEMLLHEARIAATLSHPNIVQIFDVGQIEGKYFIAMEHIHGEDIRSIVRAMKKKGVTEFPLEHTLSIVLGMCAGLAYAHERRDLDGATLDIVHRDISPQNIVVTFTGDVKVVDFGIAKSGAQAGDDTKDGQLKGKVPYMSPEQAAGEAVDWRSDIFATGVMLFELTTGKRLFKGASEFETLKLICEKEYPLPTQVRPGYPPALERIVMKALAKAKDERYQSAREMQQDLEAFVREERIPVSQVSLTKWMQSLFEEKLAQQKEALQDVKQLADIIAAQQAANSSLYEGTLTTGTGMMAPGASSTIPPTKRSNAGVIVAIVGVAALGAGGWFYMRRADAITAEERARLEAAAAQVGAAPSAEAPVPKGAIEITSKPDGCSIWIAGALRPETTPARIENLPIGSDIDVKLTKEGLEAFRQTVRLSEAEPTAKVAAQMNTGSVTVILKIEPPATVWVDGKPWKGDRNKIDGLSAGEEHKIVAAANGYIARTFTFTAKQNETKTFVDRLVKDDGTADKGGDKAKPAPGGKEEPSTPAATGPAKVRVGAKGGFCNVTVNGTSYGPTPIEAVVSAGTVRVTCKPPNGPAQSQAIKVGPGETGRVGFKIE
jgi:serine/threonine-protein kinase